MISIHNVQSIWCCKENGLLIQENTSKIQLASSSSIRSNDDKKNIHKLPTVLLLLLLLLHSWLASSSGYYYVLYHTDNIQYSKLNISYPPRMAINRQYNCMNISTLTTIKVCTLNNCIGKTIIMKHCMIGGRLCCHTACVPSQYC